MQKEMREINFRNLIWKIIFAWKKVLLGAVIGALLLVGLKYYVDSSVAGNTSIQNNSTEPVLDETQKANANKLLELYEQLNYYEQYMEESLLIKVNPLSYKVIKLQYYVASEYIYDFQNGSKNDYTAALVSAYATYITSDSFIDELKLTLDMNLANNYIRELFTVEYDIESGVIDIEAVVPNSIDAEIMMSNVKNIIHSKTEMLQEIGKHQLKEVNVSIDKTASVEKITQGNTIVRSLDAVKQSIEATRTTMTLDELIYVDNNLTYDQYKGGYIADISRATTINVKYAVVGLFVGVFLVIAYYIAVAVISNKLQDEKDIRQLFGIKSLGKIDIRKHKGGPVMNILQRIKNRHQRVYSCEEQLDKVVVGMSILCRGKDIYRIFLSSTCLHRINKDFINELKDRLKAKNIEIVGEGKIDSEAGALDKACMADGVILVEQIECSMYDEIEQEIIVSTDYDIPILGVVVIEA